MSVLTKFIRADIPGGGAVLDAIEGAEGQAVEQAVKSVVTMGIADIGNAFGASTTAFLNKKLGPAAPIAEEVVQPLLTEFEAWLESKI